MEVYTLQQATSTAKKKDLSIDLHGDFIESLKVSRASVVATRHAVLDQAHLCLQAVTQPKNLVNFICENAEQLANLVQSPALFTKLGHYLGFTVQGSDACKRAEMLMSHCEYSAEHIEKMLQELAAWLKVKAQRQQQEVQETRDAKELGGEADNECDDEAGCNVELVPCWPRYTFFACHTFETGMHVCCRLSKCEDVDVSFRCGNHKKSSESRRVYCKEPWQTRQDP